MRRFANALTLLVMAAIAATAALSCQGQDTKIGRFSLSAPVHDREMKRIFGFEPLRGGDKARITKYYEKLPASVISTEVKVGAKSILCVTVDTGSGIYIHSAFLYVQQNAAWVLLYHRAPDNRYIGLKYVVKGQQIQLMGVPFHNQQQGYNYKPITTVKIE